MNSQKLIIIKSPQPYKYVGTRFTIVGWIDLSWFDYNISASNWKTNVDYLGIDVKTFMGTTSYPTLNDQNMKEGKVSFSIDCELNYANIPFIKNSHGRITIKIESHNKSISPFYLPLIVKEFEDELTFDQKIIKKHSEVKKKEVRYEKDLEKYYKDLQKIIDSRKVKDEGKNYKYLLGENVAIGCEILKIIEEDQKIFENYAYRKEDLSEQKINEKYKDALDWIGPLARGLVSQFGGFEIRVYSDDHDKHFHVIHKDRGVNARFSFPTMKLINYKKSKNTISSKTEKRIREFCLQPEIFKKFEYEFNKRGI